jgi:hypothetical protein
VTGWIVAKIGLSLDDAANQPLALYFAHEQLANEPLCDGKRVAAIKIGW